MHSPQKIRRGVKNIVFKLLRFYPSQLREEDKGGVIVNLLVCFASMSYAVNGYGLLDIGKFIEDSIFADSDSVYRLTAYEFNA